MAGRFRWTAFAVLTVMAGCLCAAVGQANVESRVALVIGNSQYSQSPPLTNPVNDAEAMAQTLQALGFRLVGDQAHLNVTRAAMVRLLGELQDLLGTDGEATALVYYAGHGISDGASNWLVPVDDEEIRYREDVPDVAIAAQSVIRRLEGRGTGRNILILDACRNNPLESRHQTRGGPTRGLTKINIEGSATNTVIIYAAKAGQAAYDGDGDLSPFAAALIENMQVPAKRLIDVVGATANAVERATMGKPEGKQVPWMEGTPRDAFFFLPPVAEEDSSTPPSTNGPGAVEAALRLERAELRRIQARLTALGFSPGSVDGFFDRDTRRAISRWQVAQGQRGTGYLDPDSVRTLLAAVPADGVTVEPNQPLVGVDAAAVEAALRLARAKRMRVQTALANAGFYPGPSDGKFGQRTRDAIAGWQVEQGLEATGYLSADTVAALLAAAPSEALHAIAQGGSSAKWRTARNQPCEVWDEVHGVGETVTWSGGCSNGKASGWGRMVWRGRYGEEVYEGQVSGGKRDGSGTFRWVNGDSYEGEFRDGKLTGRGIYRWANGDRYEGGFRDGKQHGHGVKTWGPGGEWAGDRYEGDFRDGEFHGRGTLVWDNSDRYQGDFRDSQFHGQGVIMLANGVRYEGQVRDDRPHGEGVLREPDGDVFEGSWSRGCFGNPDGRWAALLTTPRECGFE